MLKQPVTVRDGGSSSAFPPAPPAGAPPAMPAVPAAPAAPLYGMPGYASGYGGTPTGAPAPVMHAPQTPRTPPAMMTTGTTGAAAPSGAESSEARAPLILIAADEAGNRRRIAVSPTRHQSTQHLAHQGFYHRRLPDIFIPK